LICEALRPFEIFLVIPLGLKHSDSNRCLSVVFSDLENFDKPSVNYLQFPSI
jgi:hypothetical protein